MEEFADSLSEDYQQFIGLEHEAASIAICMLTWWLACCRPKRCAAYHRQLQPGRAGPAGHDRAAGQGPDATPASAEPRAASAVGGAR